jgi:predicted PurR-regulated permease PerM
VSDVDRPTTAARPGAEDAVPNGVRVAAAWSWRLLVISGVVLAVFLLSAELSLVVSALAAALLLAAVLQPLAGLLIAKGVPRLAAAWLVFLGFIAALAAAIWFIASAVGGEMGDLRESVIEGIDEVKRWLVDGPLGLGQGQIDDATDTATRWLQEGDASGVTEGILTAANTASEVFAGTLLAFFTLFFFLYDGDRVWSWCVRVLPTDAREPVDEAGRRAWGSLVAYVRGISAVAFVDAVLIAIVLVILGVPLVPALAALTFLTAFIPIVGATVAGLAAALVALVDQGVGTALIVVVAVFLIQWLDSDILQPLIVGRAVKLHPLAIGLAVTTGAILAGIGGAIVAVPFMAAINTAVTHLASYRRSSEQTGADSA